MQVPSAGATKDPVVFTPASLTFGAITVGSKSAAQTVRITNNDSAPLTISNISASGDFAVVQPTACGATLAAGKSCTFNVTFTPTAMGTRTGAIAIVDSASSSPQTVSLGGSGVVNLTFSANKLNFSGQAVGTKSEFQTLTIFNTSTI